MKPLISILVAAYNAEKYIAEALDSCLAQTYSPIEIIVVNDSSKDNTEKIALEYATKDNRIKVFTHPNMGAALTRNRGIELAKGEWIAILDGDDVLFPHTIEEQFKYQQIHPKAVVVSDWGYYIGENSKIIGKYAYPYDLTNYEQCQKYLKEKRMINILHAGTIYRRDVILGFGGYSAEQICEDNYMWNRLVELGHTIVVNNKFLVKYRIHSKSIVSSRFNEIYLHNQWLTTNIVRRRSGLEELSLAAFTKGKEKEPTHKKMHDWFGKKELMFSRRARIAFGNSNYSMTVFNLTMLFLSNPFKAISKIIKQISLRFR